jgi:hypothetical protein
MGGSVDFERGNLLPCVGVQGTDMTARETRGSVLGKGLAVWLLLAVAAFCIHGGASMAAADMGCDGHYDSGKVCGQSGPLQPLFGIIPHVPPVQRAGSPAAWLAIRPPSAPSLQFQAVPSFPRAPPLRLHAVQS